MVSGASDKIQYLFLNPDCALKMLELPCIYNKVTNELYELDSEATSFFQQHLPIEVSNIDPTIKPFLQYCIEEKILLYADSVSSLSESRSNIESLAPTPSLRQILLNLTSQCNLKCKHCYFSMERKMSLDYDLVLNVLEQMEEMQGLFVVLSGGEPLCHPMFWDINNEFPRFDLRFELLTNGTLIKRQEAEKLNVHYVRVSVDGMEEAHDFLRGQGSFQRTLEGIKHLLQAGKEVSVSTIVYLKNLNDFNEMEKIWDDIGISNWVIDVPLPAGEWLKNYKRFAAPMEVAAGLKARFSRGEGLHEPKYKDVCGPHLCNILPNGDVYPCAFLTDENMKMGNIAKEGLVKSWARKRNMGIRLTECAECQNCSDFDVCGGGCRARARVYEKSLYAKDPFSCVIMKEKANEVIKNPCW